MPESLPTAILGRTGLEVTRLGYGAMELRGARAWGGRPVAGRQAETILNAVLDAGINLIDTAPCYGLSEALIGRHLSHRRAEFTLATKCGCVAEGDGEINNDTPHEFTRESLFRGLHGSLRRLRTDHVDILQLHNPSVDACEKEGLVAALEEMRAQGKVRWIAASTWFPELPTFLAWGAFDTFQIPYSALARRHEEAIARSGEAGLGVIVRGGVAKGEPGVGLGSGELWAKFAQARLDELRAEGESRTAFLLRYTLSHPFAHTIIVGTLQPEHLLENVRTVRRGALAPDVYAEATRRLDAIGETPKPMP